MDLDSCGKLYGRSQLNDYCARGSELEAFNVLEFFVNTYEESISTTSESMDIDEKVQESSQRKGRPKHDRVSYQSNHPKYGQVQRVIRPIGHHNLPNFIGQYFPRRNEPQTYDFYCASMMMLLKPWRVLEKDLKSSNETWSDAFDSFMASSEGRSRRTHDIIAGIQYFYDCESAASVDEGDKQMSEDIRERENGPEYHFGAEEDIDNLANEDNPEDMRDEAFTSEGLEDLIISQTPINEAIHAHFAIELARRAHVFTGDEQKWNVTSKLASKATGDGMSRLLTWRNQLDSDLLKRNSGLGSLLSNEEQDSRAQPSVSQL